MRSLMIYLKNYKKETVLAPLFKMLEALFDLFVPLVMAAVIDKGIARSDQSYIVRMCLLLIALGIIGLTCSITAQYFAAKAATGFAAEVRHALFAHVQKFTFSEMDTIGTSTLITRMTSDLNQVQSGLNLTLRLLLRSPFIVFGAMIMAFMIDIKAALVFVVAIPLLAVIVFSIMLMTMPLYKKVQAHLDQVLLVTRENLTGARVIRAFNKEEDEKRRFEENNQLLTRAQKFVGSISGLMNPLTYIVINGAVIVLIYTGAVRVNIGELTQGQVVALLNYMSQILVELVKLANLIISITKALACANRIQSVFEEKPDMQDGTLVWKVDSDEKQIPRVEFEHVSLTYQGAGAESLSDISFKAYQGQTIGIIGGTGSGKSSLVNLIPRFYDATRGEIRIDGRNVKEYQMDSLRERVGMVLQKAVLFKGTIGANIRWGKEDATDAEIEEALEISQAKEFVDSKKEGLNFKIEQSGRNLSGGQKQRLTIARALATDAKLRKAIREMKEQPTVFIVSQRASSIQYADQILVLDDGELAGVGTHRELLENCPAYQEIYYSQFPKEKEA